MTTKPRKWKPHLTLLMGRYYTSKGAQKAVRRLKEEGYEVQVFSDGGLSVIYKRKPLDKFPLTEREIKKRQKEEAKISKRETRERQIGLRRSRAPRITPKTPRLRR